MRLSIIWAIFAKEMLETFRDRRTLIVSIFIPIMMLPMTMGLFVYFASGKLPEYRYALVGGAAGDDALIEDVLDNEDQADFLRVSPSRPREALRQDELEVVVALDGSPAHAEQEVAIVVQHNASLKSKKAAELISAQLEDYAKRLVTQRLARSGETWPLAVALENVTPDSNPSLIGIFFPLIAVMWITVGAMYPAGDVTAGEKDRRTIGDILLTPASRLEIALGKFLAVSLIALVTLLIAILSMFAGVEMGNLAPLRLRAGGASAASLAWVIPTVLLTTAIVSALEMIASLFARSFKEAQTYLTPIFLIVLIPGGLLSVTPELAQVEWLYWMPFMNSTMLLRELMLDVINPAHIAMTFSTSLVGSLLLLWLMVKLFNREDVLFST
ncbi:MAG TPA: ABC transporter permease [Chloroflexi bacterium]|nr:ABC transporter permease [Chloroflexota bacterium]